MRTGTGFDTIRSLGSMLPPDLLERIASGDKTLEGLRPEDYHLHGEKINEATSRAWNRLSALWPRLRTSMEAMGDGQPTAALTRDRWLLPLFEELGFGRLQPLKQSEEVEGKTYPISHIWNRVPIHLMGYGIDLDRRTRGTVGAATQSPHSMLQDFLNSSDDNLWGFVSNGQTLRILRDNISMTRQAYVEFDLEGMMDGEAYSDFTLLWLLCHQSRVEGDRPELCWLEKWSQQAQQDGTRALEALRAGVENAITALGQGFLSYRANNPLRDQLRSGNLSTQDYYRQLLRLVYRILFLMVVEARNLLHTPDASHHAKSMYERFYSLTRLRDIAEKKKGSRHPDLWRTIHLVFSKLSSVDGCPELGLPALGSFLWSTEAIPDLEASDISNYDILEVFRHLALLVEKQGGYRRIDFRNLGSEELGSVYESLLELQPELNTETSGFKLNTLAGNERKKTGSYYTPTSLINELLNSALEPVIEQRVKTGWREGQAGAEQALLGMKVCDPASGSGHFLIAASHRLAKRLAAIRTGEDEPAPEPYRHALRDVISHCIYGVDINPMAVELCKVSLWLEALEPGKPLSFLDHHIKCGNSLLGTTPELIKSGVPDGAFSPITGDDKTICSKLKKTNKQERAGQMRLLFDDVGSFRDDITTIALQVAEIDSQSENSVMELRQKETRYNTLEISEPLRRSKLVADAWCSAFIWEKTGSNNHFITTDTIRRLQGRPESVPIGVKDGVCRLAEEYKFFHWHLEYPDVFAGDDPGFDVVLGNPPWEHTELKEKEFFSAIRPDIAAAPGARRKKMILGLEEHDPQLFLEFCTVKRSHDVYSHFARGSGMFPLCGTGRINTYSLFSELNRSLISGIGRVGCIVPSGIATDDTTKYFFQDLMETKSLVSFYEFENEGFFSAGQGHMVRFALVTLSGSALSTGETEFMFQGKTIQDLSDEDRLFELSADDIALINPNTRTCPIFRSKQDAELTKYIYNRVPVLINENDPENGNPWGISFKQGLFNMTSDSHLFRTREELEEQGWTLKGNVFEKGGERYLPLYEAKMINIYDHRYGDYGAVERGRRVHVLPDVPIERKTHNDFSPLPYYWVHESEVTDKLRNAGWHSKWLIGWRDVTDARASARTVIASVIPAVGVGDKYLIELPSVEPKECAALLACQASYPCDYVARQKVGGLSLKYFTMRQIAILPPSLMDRSFPFAQGQAISEWIKTRVLELTYTAWDLKPLADDLGYTGPPFIWDDKRRFHIRCELDAAFFHLYLGTPEDWNSQGTSELRAAFPAPRDAVEHIMETFPIVKRKDIQEFGKYRTKDTILEIYDSMSEAMKMAIQYETLIYPLPGSPS